VSPAQSARNLSPFDALDAVAISSASLRSAAAGVSNIVGGWASASARSRSAGVKISR
jgi:hypothetical protein